MAWWAGSLSSCRWAEHSCPLTKPLSSPQKHFPFIRCPLELAKTQSMNTGGPLRRPSKNLANHRAGAFLSLPSALPLWVVGGTELLLGKPQHRIWGGCFVALLWIWQAGQDQTSSETGTGGARRERSGARGSQESPGFPIHWQHKEHFIFCFCSLF